jgi:hypothetical protein
MPADQRDLAAIPIWPKAIVGLGIILLAAGAVIALLHPVLLVSPHGQINEATRVYAGYLASRNMALALMLFLTLVRRANKSLNILVLLTAVIQLFDIVMDISEGRWAVLPPVIILGVLLLLASTRISGHPFWKTEAWT